MKPKHLYVRTQYVVEGTLWARFPVINVDRVADIPADYPGPMGVPITFMDKYNPERFQLLGRRGHLRLENGKETYQRLIVRNLKPNLPEIIDLTEWFERTGVPLDVVPFNAGGMQEGYRPEYRRLPSTSGLAVE